MGTLKRHIKDIEYLDEETRRIAEAEISNMAENEEAEISNMAENEEESAENSHCKNVPDLLVIRR
jgi:hypothetical protein